VQEVLWEEFAEAYANHHDQRFLNMIDNGMYLNAFCITAIEAQLSASPGYRAYLNKQAQLSLSEQSLFLSLEKKSLWANRHSSVEAQKAFDCQYGLIIAP